MCHKMIFSFVQNAHFNTCTHPAYDIKHMEYLYIYLIYL